MRWTSFSNSSGAKRFLMITIFSCFDRSPRIFSGRQSSNLQKWRKCKINENYFDGQWSRELVFTSLACASISPCLSFSFSASTLDCNRRAFGIWPVELWSCGRGYHSRRACWAPTQPIPPTHGERERGEVNDWICVCSPLMRSYLKIQFSKIYGIHRHRWLATCNIYAQYAFLA